MGGSRPYDTSVWGSILALVVGCVTMIEALRKGLLSLKWTELEDMNYIVDGDCALVTSGAHMWNRNSKLGGKGLRGARIFFFGN